MPLYGYARVSTFDQDLGIQRAALKAAGCKVVRAEKASGTRRDGRTELQVLLDFVQPGDTLVVTRIDRLARSMKDLQARIASRSADYAVSRPPRRIRLLAAGGGYSRATGPCVGRAGNRCSGSGCRGRPRPDTRVWSGL